MRLIMMVLLTSVLVAGCVTVPPAPIPAPGTSRVETKPELGALTSREVGEALFQNEVTTTYKALVMPSGARLQVGHGFVAALERSPTLATSSTGVSVYCAPASLLDRNGRVVVQAPAFCRTAEEYKSMGANFTEDRIVQRDSENFRRELLYQGKVGNELKVSYREFVGDMARPAFTQEFSFDLSEGRVIGVKGARIEVVEANNTAIRYRVLQPFTERP